MHQQFQLERINLDENSFKENELLGSNSFLNFDCGLEDISTIIEAI